MRPVSDGGSGEPFAPIAEYGFLSDAETTALLAPSGNVEWMCVPLVDSPSVFGSLLDRDAGYFRVGPAGVDVPTARRYIPGTLVLETTWWTPGGWLVVLDTLLMGPWHHETERSHTHRRAPTDYDADHVLLRMLRCVNGQIQARLDCLPIFDYGRTAAQWSHTGAGYHEATAGNDVSLRLTTDLNVGFEGPLATARTLLKEGDRRFVALSWSEHVLHARLRLGGQRLLLLHHRRRRGRRGSPADHVRRRRPRELDESSLDHLCGYDGARPVRAGNAACMQEQHDVWGGVIGSIYLFVRKRDRLDDRLWSLIVKQVEMALVQLAKPDHGMWEVRGQRGTSPHPSSSAGWPPTGAPSSR